MSRNTVLELTASALCPPDMVVEFVKRTGIDIMAPAIGTAHGVYKIPNPGIDLDRFKTIQELLNGSGLTAPLVVHGGTGLSDSIVESLVGLGAAKFNVSTELKHVLIDTTFEYIKDHRNEYNPGVLDREVKQAIMDAVSGWMKKLGSSGTV